MNRRFVKASVWFLSLALFCLACDKDEEEEKPQANCSGTDLQIEILEVTNAACGTPEGTIAVNALQASGPVQFSINNGAFQTSGTFEGLKPGKYSISAKDENGCTTSANATIESGISFQATVKSIIDTNCAISGCHVSGTGRANFTEFGNISSRAAEIKSRTQTKDMPRGRTLSDAEIAQIACWVDDGAKNN